MILVKPIAGRESIHGMNALIKGLNDLADGIRGKPRTNVVGKSADFLAKVVRDRAPRGETGNLKKAVVARMQKGPFGSNAYVTVDYKIAPHAHLVERGTGPRSPTSRSVMAFDVNGRRVFAKSVGPMPRQPFFFKGVEAGRDRAMDIIDKGLSTYLDTIW